MKYLQFLSCVTILISFLLDSVTTTPTSNLLNSRGGHGHGGGPGWNQCLTDAEAQVLVDIIISVSVKFDPTYVAPFFSDDFTVQSDSVNFLIGLDTGVITASNKTLFLESSYQVIQAENPPPITWVYILHSCTDIAFKWISHTTPYVLQGIDIMKTVHTGHSGPGAGGWQIQTDWSEFNDAVALINAKLFPCPA